MSRTPALALLASIAALLVLGAAPAAAQEQIGSPCGRVNAYTAPTATTDGSITIGSRRFVVRAGAPDPTPAPPQVGAVLCLSAEHLDPAGRVFSALHQRLYTDTPCGEVARATQTTITLRGRWEWTFPVRAGTTFTPEQLTGSQCFKTEVNAAGDQEIVAFAFIPAQTRPAPPAAARPAQLPGTSTDPTSPAPIFAAALLAAAGLLALRASRTR